MEALNTDYSLTLLLNLTILPPPSCSFKFLVDFFEFIVTAVEEGHLVAGHWLIVDNASVHFSLSTWEPLTTLLAATSPVHLPANVLS